MKKKQSKSLDILCSLPSDKRKKFIAMLEAEFVPHGLEIEWKALLDFLRETPDSPTTNGEGNA